MQLRSTSSLRTYRYVRLSILGAVVFLAVAVAAQILSAGPLGSISASYYTPAGPVFVAALCAVCAALIALSGRSLEQALLDLAAVFAPIIAFVPVPLGAAEAARLGVACPGFEPCVPAAVLPEVRIAVLALTAVGLLAVAGALVLVAVQRTAGPSSIIPIAGAATVIGGGALWWTLAPDAFLRSAHDAATALFFALIAVVAGLAAWRPAGRPRRRRALRVLYAAVAVGIAASLVFLLIVSSERGEDGAAPASFFVGECVALGLFAAFWLLQTVEVWEDADPAILWSGRE